MILKSTIEFESQILSLFHDLFESRWKSNPSNILLELVSKQKSSPSWPLFSKLQHWGHAIKDLSSTTSQLSLLPLSCWAVTVTTDPWNCRVFRQNQWILKLFLIWALRRLPKKVNNLKSFWRAFPWKINDSPQYTFFH